MILMVLGIGLTTAPATESVLSTLPTAYLPDWLHPLSEILPVGVGVRALQGLSHFDNDGLATGIAVLTAWTLAAAAALYWRDTHVPRRNAAVGTRRPGRPQPSAARTRLFPLDRARQANRPRCHTKQSYPPRGCLCERVRQVAKAPTHRFVVPAVLDQVGEGGEAFAEERGEVPALLDGDRAETLSAVFRQGDHRIALLEDHDPWLAVPGARRAGDLYRGALLTGHPHVSPSCRSQKAARSRTSTHQGDTPYSAVIRSTPVVVPCSTTRPGAMLPTIWSVSKTKPAPR
ncbi:hypothetical protein ACIO8G_03495 [Streptomyces sp. NPDC087219]|uniref:hypothetical protein n=1 Tax=Streptomyces sp. NPDC087219 TaxID=3365770 RepID=UPI0038304EFC